MKLESKRLIIREFMPVKITANVKASAFRNYSMARCTHVSMFHLGRH